MSSDDTVPLPAVHDDAGGPDHARAPAQPPGAGLRAVEVLAGLVSGGLVLIGFGLLVLQLVAPDIAPGTGLAAATGPTWWRVWAQLGVGIAGECAVWLRPRCPIVLRRALAAAVLVAAAVVLYVAWWQ